MKTKRPQLDLFREKASDRVKRQIGNLVTLAERGATEGERKAARKAMERLISKYDLDVSNINEISRQEYTFTWTSNMEVQLFVMLCKYFLEREDFKVQKRNWSEDEYGRMWEARELAVTLDRLEYITIECAYEYFRRHMKKEWKRLVIPKLNRCRKAKTRKKKKEQLEPVFFKQYLIRSKLVESRQMTREEIEEMSDAERARLFDLRDMEGGEYNQQVGNGLYLGAAK